MKVNPVYRQETKAAARSFQLPLTIFGFNSVLALVALLDMYSVITQVHATAEIHYSSFISLYVFVATVEFVLLLLIIPAITAGSISGERERQTLDLLLTTKLTPADIVTGKLMSSLSTVFLLVASSFPILSLVFIYGGVTLWDMALLVVCYISTALLAGCIGICCSSVFERSTIASVVSYGAVAALVLGTVGVNRLAQSFQVSSGASQAVKIRGTSYLLFLNPAATFAGIMEKQIGTLQRTILWGNPLSALPVNIVSRNWLIFSVAAQIALAVVCLWIAVRGVDPRRRTRGNGSGL